MENKIYIVPDVHCRDFYKPVLDIKDKPVIFLGDYMDPYVNEGFTDKHGIKNLQEIIDFARNNKNVTLLVGNHDCSWIWDALRWERTSYLYYKELHQLYRDNIDLFTSCIRLKDTLFTHAGVSDGWIDHINNMLEYKKSSLRLNQDNVVMYIDNEFRNELLREGSVRRGMSSPYLESPIFDIGAVRWGDSTYGGPFWDDIREYQDPEGWTIKQIFSHTQLDKTGSSITVGNGTCIDSRAIFEYDLDTHELIESSLNEKD